MNTENQISLILKNRGFKTIQPTDDLLAELSCTARRFFKIYDGKVEMTLQEAINFANWLGVPVEDLTTAPTPQTHTLAEKFGLNH